MQVSLHARCVHRQMPWWTSLWPRSDLFQLSASTAGMMGRFFTALHTGAGPGVVSTGTRPPKSGASCALISTETCALHTGSHHHHQVSQLKTCFLCGVTVSMTQAGDSSVVRTGAARRRRERRLRSMLRHERQTVAMELAVALHHSRDVGSGTYVGLRAQETASSVGGREVEEHETNHALRRQMALPPGARPGILVELAPQRSDRTVRRSAGVTHPACPCCRAGWGVG